VRRPDIWPNAVRSIFTLGRRPTLRNGEVLPAVFGGVVRVAPQAADVQEVSRSWSRWKTDECDDRHGAAG
jgi:hypothetical protein